MLNAIHTNFASSNVLLPTGATLFIQRAGDGEELLIFVHAVGGDHSSWQKQMHAFSGKYTCISLDLRGHGKSKRPSEHNGCNDDVTIKAFAQDIAALIKHVGFAQAHVVGLSMGGVVALELCHQHRELVQSLTLANTWCHHPDGEARIAFMEEQLQKKTLAQSSQELIAGLFAKGTSKEQIDAAIKVEGTKDPDVFLNSWRSMFRVDYRDMLKTIRVPLLLIGGTEDKATPTDPLLTLIDKNCRMSWLVNIEGANHFSNIDHPEQFNNALRVNLRRARANSDQRTTAPILKTEKIPANTTAEALMYMLSSRGVEYFFSNSGTDFTPIIDALARYKDDSKFKMQVVVAPHENTAIGMAHGYFLLSGKPQVTMAHVNVGTANMGLGIINASRSRIPVLVMSGKTPWYETGMAGCRTNFVQWGQETFDQAAYFREFTKWDYELKSHHNLETAVDRAFAIAQSQPAGPVYLSLPKEPLCETIEQFAITSPARQQPNSPAHPDEAAIERAANAIAAAKNPVIVTSELGRFRGGPEALVQLAELMGISVIEHGKRNFFNFPTEHPLHLGFSPSPFVEKADLIIAVECHVPWIPAHSNVEQNTALIQIGVDPLFHKLPMRGFAVDMSICAEPALGLNMLSKKLGSLLATDEKLATKVHSRAKQTGTEHKSVFSNGREQAARDRDKTQITKKYLSYCIGKVVDDETVIFNEYDLDPMQVPRRLSDSWFENSIASGLGWSLGAALGGKLASPESTIVVTLGDGSYMFNTPISAHYVAAAYDLPIMIVVFNDSAWSTIKLSTKGSHQEGWAARTNSFALCDFNVDVKFEKLAEAVGGAGIVVDRPEQLESSLREGLRIVREDRKHVLVNVVCERDG